MDVKLKSLINEALVLLVDDQAMEVRQVSGGDSHSNYYIAGEQQNYFVKTNVFQRMPVLESEEQSLNLINSTGLSSKYPTAHGCHNNGFYGVLVMEALELEPIRETHAESVAQALIVHHSLTADQFGWSLHNFIGSTPQYNTHSDSWADFFSEQRLGRQLELLGSSGLSESSRQRVLDCIRALPDILGDRSVSPTLVHGDLWLGNIAMASSNKETVFYDPAPYYGDPEVDIAMSCLFGRLPAKTYQMYRTHFPLAVSERRLHAVYNLYHALNHVLLFGQSYESLVCNLTDSALLSEKS